MFLTRVNDRDGTNRDETKARPRIGSWTRDDSFPLSFFSLVSSHGQRLAFAGATKYPS